VVVVTRGRKKQGDGMTCGGRQWKRGDHRREGEEGDGWWDDTRCMRMGRRGRLSTSDGVDARMMRSRQKWGGERCLSRRGEHTTMARMTSFNTSYRCLRGEGKEGGRGWDKARSDRLFFHGESEF